MDNSKEDHYGNACVVGHTGNVFLVRQIRKNSKPNKLCKSIKYDKVFISIVGQEKISWGRDCVDGNEVEEGCHEEKYQNTTIQMCVCKEEGCNEKMDDESTTTSKVPTTTHKRMRIQFKQTIVFVVPALHSLTKLETSKWK